MRRSLALLPVLLVLLQPILAYHAPIHAYAYTREVEVRVPAVRTLPNGTETGMLAKLRVSAAYPGTGQVYLSANPLAEIDTQATARIAVLVACYLANVDPRAYDFYITFESPSIIIGGPSAGVAMTVALLAALRGDQLRGDIIATGMVNPDGTVGPVGGLLAKLHAAAEGGAKTFLIPVGQRQTYRIVVEERQQGPIVVRETKRVPVDLAEEGRKLGVQVVEVSSIREAYKYFTGKEIPPRTAEPRLPDYLAEMLTQWIENHVSNATQALERARNLTSTLPEAQRGYVEDLLSQAEKLIDTARNLQQERPYTAASLTFQAAVVAEHALAVARVLSDEDPAAVVNGLLGEAEKLVNNTKDVLKSSPRSYEELELLIAVADRYHAALEAISNARQLLEAGELYDNPAAGSWGALHEAAYAKWRAVTVTEWLELLDRVPTGEAIPREDVDTLARFMLYYAQSVLSYATALYEDLGMSSGILSTGEDLYSKAEDTYMEGDIYGSLSYSLDAAVHGTLAIFAAFTTNLTAIAEASKAEAYDTLARLSDRGIAPPLSLSYLEFAEHQASPESSLYYYELAASYLKTLYYLSSAQGPVQGTETTTTTPQPGAASTVTVTVTETTTETETRIVGGQASMAVVAAALLLGVAVGAAAALLAGRRGQR